MRDEQRFLINLEKLDRYRPDISVRLKTTSYNRLEPRKTQKGEWNLLDKELNRCYHSPVGALEEAQRWFQFFRPKLLTGQILIIYGIGLGYYYDAAKLWLRENPKNRILIFEDDLEVLYYFLQTERATEMLDDPQVLIHYMKGDASERYWLQEVLRSCYDINGIDPVISIIPLLYYSKSKNQISDLFIRRILYIIESFRTLKESFWDLTPIAYNYYSNFFCLPQIHFGKELSGKFEKIPAIICGAGPSLKKNVHLLKDLDNRAILFSGGTTTNILGFYDIIPHFCVGIDPNPSHYARVLTQNAFEVPFFINYRMHHQAVKQIQAPKLLLTEQKTNFEKWFNNELNFPKTDLEGGFSVGNAALQIAQFLGCDPIVFVGMDLAWTDQKPYAEGVLDHPLVSFKKNYNRFNSLQYQDKDVEGKPVKTTYQFVIEVEWITRFIKDHPDTEFINATEGGKPIPGISNRNLLEVAQEKMLKSYDLRNTIHQEILNIPGPFLTMEKVHAVIKKWLESCKRSLTLLNDYLDDLIPYQEKPVYENELPTDLINQLSLRELDFKDDDLYHYYLRFFDANACVVLKAKENHWYRKQGKVVGGEQLELSVDNLFKRFRFLQNRLELNIKALDANFKLLKDPRESPWTPVPAKEGSGNVPLSSEEHYFLKNGTLKIWDPDCGIFIEESYVPGVAISPDTKEPIQEGHLIRTYPSGLIKSEVFYKKGNLHGPATFFSDMGTIMAKSWFYEGNREGKSWQYYISGALYSLQRYAKGLRNGKQEFYYEDGRTRTIMNYREGQLDGVTLLYHSDGILKREIHFKEGKRHGKEKIWFDNGSLLLEAQYDKGIPIGTFQSWHHNGEPELKVMYKEPGVAFESIEWDDKGKIIQKRTTPHVK